MWCPNGEQHSSEQPSYCSCVVGIIHSCFISAVLSMEENSVKLSDLKAEASVAHSPALEVEAAEPVQPETGINVDRDSAGGLGTSVSKSAGQFSMAESDAVGVESNLGRNRDVSEANDTDNLTCMTDRAVVETSLHLAHFKTISSFSDTKGEVDGLERENSELNIKGHRQLSKDGGSAVHHGQVSPQFSHQPPSGPFVTEEQQNVLTGAYTGKSFGFCSPSFSDDCLEKQEGHPMVAEARMFWNQYGVDTVSWYPGEERHSVRKMVPSMPRQHKVRTDLSLADKVRLINTSETTGRSQRSLAAEFNISVGSVNNILRRKREYKSAFENREDARDNRGVKVPCLGQSSTDYMSDHLHKLMTRWLETAKFKVKQLTWPQVVEKAFEFAGKLNLTNFHASAPWVSSLRQSMDFPVRGRSICARSDSEVTLLGMWHKMLPFLVQGYQPENVFSVAETTLYYRCLPDCCFIGGPVCQHSNSHLDLLEDKVTVLLCCSMAGERLKPLIISRHPCPASLHGVPVEDLPVVWCHHPKPVITTDIFAGWLRSLEASMEQQGRHIALFMEMTPSHLSTMLLKHISLKFYLDGSAHLLQPLHQGIVRHFKAYFRRRLLQMALAHHSAEQRDRGVSGGQLAVKAVTELDVVFWIQESWRSISSHLITECFRTTVFPSGSSDHTRTSSAEPLPNDFLHLIHEAARLFHFTPMAADTYADFDSHMACHDGQMEEWEESLFMEVAGRQLKPIKKEPSDFVGETEQHCSSLREVRDKGAVEPVSAPEALDSLGRLKRFSASNIGLLTTVFELESLVLDSLGSSGHC